jgi:GTP cyclohydrolase II/3,4-dihydroxy 2-butanone 4-phosphate synthase/GTP cyclohydrolase II
VFNLYSKASLPTAYGDFTIYTFSNDEKKDHAVLVRGEVKGKEGVPLRIHSECLTGDVFSSLRCDCHDQLVQSLKYLVSVDFGILIYLRQEGRGIGLLNKIKAYSLQEEGYDTVEANVALGLPIDQRDYSFVINVLNYFEIKSVKLMSNNPTKFDYLKEKGVNVIERIPVLSEPRPEDKFYLETKKVRLGHKI